MTAPAQTNAFAGSTKKPTDEELTAALGPARAVWDRLLADLAEQHDITGQEWKSYSPKAGWSLRVTRKKRTIVWLAPSRHAFDVLFILGDKAVRAAKESGLPKSVAGAISTAPKYPEGTGVRLAVRSARDVPALMKLAAIKLAN